MKIPESFLYRCLFPPNFIRLCGLSLPRSVFLSISSTLIPSPRLPPVIQSMLRCYVDYSLSVVVSILRQINFPSIFFTRTIKEMYAYISSYYLCNSSDILCIISCSLSVTHSVYIACSAKQQMIRPQCVLCNKCEGEQKPKEIG